jgi:hypothetical protein
LKKKEGTSFRHPLQITMSLEVICRKRSPTGRIPKASQYQLKVAVQGARNMQSLLTIPRQERRCLVHNTRGENLIPLNGTAHLSSNSLSPLTRYLELLQKLFTLVVDCNTYILGVPSIPKSTCLHEADIWLILQNSTYKEQVVCSSEPNEKCHYAYPHQCLQRHGFPSCARVCPI